MFDPKSGSVLYGHHKTDICKLPLYSTTTGYKNKSDTPYSFITGAHNHIRKHHGRSHHHHFGSSSIIGGFDNTIISKSGQSSSIIASENVTVNGSNNTVVLGIKGKNKHDKDFCGFDESVITKNLYALNSLHVGDHTSHDNKYHFTVDGTAYVHDDLVVHRTIFANNLNVDCNEHIGGKVHARDVIATNNISAREASFEHVHIVNATIDNINSNGNKSLFAQATADNNRFVVDPRDNVSIIYAVPIQTDVNIYLGSKYEHSFAPNSTITIKDATLNFAPFSSHNIIINVPQGVYIENIVNGTNVIQQTNGGAYIIKGVAGAVTLRYQAPLMPGGRTVWCIQDRIQGNERVSPSAIRFEPTSEDSRMQIIRGK